MLTSLAADKKSKNFQDSQKFSQILELHQKLDLLSVKTRQMSSEEEEQEQDRKVHVDQPCGW